MRPLPSLHEVAPSRPLHPLQEAWTHRSPYIYLPSENKIYWGWPGTFHGDLAQDIRAKHELPIENRDTIYGSVYQHPLDPTLYAHSLHSWARDRSPVEEERLSQAIGIPVNPYVGPEWQQDDFQDEDWTHWNPGVGMMRMAMADRSGNPEVDKLIEQFLQIPMGDWTTDTDPIEALRDPIRSHGACDEVTEQFVSFAKERGFNAYVTQTDLEEMGYEPSGDPHGDVLNDAGEIEPGYYQEHTVASIYLPEQKFPIIVDFTASQYGFTDHPKVSKTASTPEGYEIRPNTGWFSHDTPWNQENEELSGGLWHEGVEPRLGTNGMEDPYESRVAYYQGQPVASVTWRTISGGNMIGTAWTHPEHRNKGLFNALAEELRGQPVDAYHWDNPWLKRKVRSWPTSS